MGDGYPSPISMLELCKRSSSTESHDKKRIFVKDCEILILQGVFGVPISCVNHKKSPMNHLILPPCMSACIICYLEYFCTRLDQFRRGVGLLSLYF